MPATHPRPTDLERLASDLRVFDANGIERAAWGWDRHEARGLDPYHRAEKVERAAFGAALGLFARDGISRDEHTALVAPMAEALPWLVPDRRPAARV